MENPLISASAHQLAQNLSSATFVRKAELSSLVESFSPFLNGCKHTTCKGVTRYLRQCRNWIVVSGLCCICVAVNCRCTTWVEEKSIRCSPPNHLLQKCSLLFRNPRPRTNQYTHWEANHREIGGCGPHLVKTLTSIPRGKCQSQQMSDLFHCRCSVSTQWELGSSSLTTFHFSLCHVYDLLFFNFSKLLLSNLLNPMSK